MGLRLIVDVRPLTFPAATVVHFDSPFLNYYRMSPCGCCIFDLDCKSFLFLTFIFIRGEGEEFISIKDVESKGRVNSGKEGGRGLMSISYVYLTQNLRNIRTVYYFNFPLIIPQKSNISTILPHHFQSPQI